MERLLTLLGQDKELLYIELSQLPYKDMKAFCISSKDAKKLCSEKRFEDLLVQKREELLMYLAYPKLKELCEKYKEVQDICNDEGFWEKKTRRDFGSNKLPYYTWKEMYETRYPQAAMRIIKASGKGDFDTVIQLLEFGIDPNTKDPKSGRTALMEASSKGHIEIVKKLLEFGADPNIQHPYAGTALDLARFGRRQFFHNTARWKSASELVELLEKVTKSSE